MKRLISFLAVLAMLMCFAVGANAENANVQYSGNAGEFVFSPGSDASVTDLFPNFKGVMPGDSLEQKITVKNDASRNVKVKIYLRSLGADSSSDAFLSQLHLQVTKSQENDMPYMFDAAANESAQLTDWVCLGTLYSGGTVNLNVILDVPNTMGNDFQDQIGYLTWMFKVEEFPVEDGDPKPPPTGDPADLLPVILLMTACAAAFIFLVIFYKRKKSSYDN